ncbi:G-protein coupled receptor [Colletotrichum truncatum]|uniref:G-protein coupled receptor n=1 Tax=Colletotrichum truncatum TaxID=5467 RepID=A0ACC3Z655_COLTU
MTFTRRYLVVSILFFLALIATWLPSMTNRVYSIVHPDPPIFWLNLMAAFVLTLQGFWNAMVYLGTSWALCRDHLLQKLRYLLSGRQLPRTSDAALSTIETNRQRV